MKNKYSNIIFLFLIGILIFSCSNSKNNTAYEENITPTELEDLQIKYNKLEIKDCEELFAVGNEMIDVYISTINRAYEGNERAKSDLLDFDSFTQKFDIEATKISENCPEEFKEWTAEVEKRVFEVNDKLIELLNTDYYEYIELDDSIIKDLDRQLKELNEDIKKMLEEEYKKDSIEATIPETPEDAIL